MLQAATQHPPSKPSFGNLGFFQCCAAGCHPAPPSKPIRESYSFFQCCRLPRSTRPALRAAIPHLLPSPHSGILASFSAAGCHAAPSFQALIRESWLLPVLRCRLPSRTSFQALIRESYATQHPPSKPSFGNLGFFQCCAAGCHPAPPSKPSFGNLSFFQCCRLPRSTLLPSPHSGILASSSAALRAAIPHLLPSPHIRES